MKDKIRKSSRVDIYISAVIISSIVLSILALWALVWQYQAITYQLQNQTASVIEGEQFGAFSKISIFALSMIILSLVIILILGSYLSTRDLQRQVELASLKSDFVATVSHELKTPLTSIRLLAERLLNLKSNESAKQREYHGLILAQSHKLSRLIANILDFSKLEKEGNEKYKLEKADLAQLLKQCIDDYPIKLTRPDCKLDVNISSQLPPVYLNKEAISQAFINLLDNAIKVSPSGGVIKVNANKTTDTVFIEVIDQGPGIEEERKKRIFERFYHTGKGTGLGLTLVLHIVEGHEGKVEVESERGKGSKFKIVLPIRKVTS